MSTIAEIVNDWFQCEPSPERQQNTRRGVLIQELREFLDQLADQVEGFAGTDLNAESAAAMIREAAGIR